MTSQLNGYELIYSGTTEEVKRLESKMGILSEHLTLYEGSEIHLDVRREDKYGMVEVRPVGGDLPLFIISSQGKEETPNTHLSLETRVDGIAIVLKRAPRECLIFYLFYKPHSR